MDIEVERLNRDFKISFDSMKWEQNHSINYIEPTLKLQFTKSFRTLLEHVFSIINYNSDISFSIRIKCNPSTEV